MTTDGAPDGLDDAAIEALLGDATTLDKDTLTPPADWKPPTFEEWTATQEKLTKANNGAKNIRLKLAALQGKKPATPVAIPPKPGSPAAGGENGDKPVDAAALRAEIEAEFKAKQDQAATQSAVITALLAGGLQVPEKDRTAAVRRAARLVDMDGLTADDAAGIDAAVEALKGTYPGLFAAVDGGDGGRTSVKAHTRRLGGPGAAATQGKDNGQALGTAEQLAQKIFGTAR